jgi:hypothetical protein
MLAAMLKLSRPVSAALLGASVVVPLILFACVGTEPLPDEVQGADGGIDGTAPATDGGVDSATPAEPTDPASPALCAEYCGAIMDGCTGENAQYDSEATCRAVCSSWLTGKPNARTGNTAHCRLTQAKTAGDTQSCREAGPFASGRCGTPCGGFCEVVAKHCDPKLSGYSDVSACKERCGSEASHYVIQLDAGFGPDPARVPNANTFNCRAYHMHLALSAPPSTLEGHCVHVGPTPADGMCSGDAGAETIVAR